MGRVAARFALAVALVAPTISAPARSDDTPVVLKAVVDDDDDDGDGVPDGRQDTDVPPADLVRLPGAGSTPVRVRAVVPEGAVRVLVDRKPIPVGTSVAADRIRLQALAPGRHTVHLGSMRVEVRAVRITAFDGQFRQVDLTTSHASFQRTPPDRLDDIAQRIGDPDALRYVVVGHPEDLPDHLRIESRTERALPVDLLRKAKTVRIACPLPVPAPLACRSTWPIRVVGDLVDQGHPLVVDRSVRGALGGGLILRAGSVAQQIRIGGPRHTRHGPMRRFRGKLRLTVMRTWPDGAPSLGGMDAAALAAAREQLDGTNTLWQQCGFSFGSVDQADIRIEDPPPPFLVAVGCDLGLPSSGGRIRLTIDGSEVSLLVPPGLTPAHVARKLAREIQAIDYRVLRSSNARIGPGSYPVVDLMVRRASDRPARIAVPGGGPASTDPTMPVCVGRVDLARGLKHFLDVDSMAGTVQERTLLKWIDDRDPGTLDSVFIPAFGGGGGRIGESFIGTDRSSLRNLVIVDRAGVAAWKASHTLAHEVGHVLLDVPGHPDDYGVDQPTLLMDSDAAIASAFGPRRITVAECERAWRQSGPKAPVVLLEPWPLGPLSK